MSETTIKKWIEDIKNGAKGTPLIETKLNIIGSC